MKITLDYRKPTPSHCDVGVFVNGALAGVLTLRQEEIVAFQDVIVRGLHMPGDVFLGTGDPGEPASSQMLAHDFPDMRPEYDFSAGKRGAALTGCAKGHENPLDCLHLRADDGVLRCAQCGYTMTVP